ncbi:MAG: putative 2-aminoethylphosphonate ABC transporter permease subunit [Candidatus Competibacteraceae bacterium]|nr:putative 2-aminoethylphosphonate ABC transporter permease subunit [Candidatus Competibacteraceae bacterium]MBK8753297.1 putative 2-aminoethylphosphonate ABC transporter permease subunit [Candidatus Competibacteraceae bacterium]
MVEVATVAALRIRPRLGRDGWLMGGGLLVLALYLAVTLLVPLIIMLAKSTQDSDGAFVGLANFAQYFSNPALSSAVGNSLWVSALSTLMVIALAFGYAYALNRSCIPFKGFFRLVAMAPLLAPSLLSAIALIYLFGNQGALKGWLLGEGIYGPIGIVMGSVFWTFPHALIILTTALSTADARLYEASESLGASRWRTFTTVTLPGVRYGLISAIFVVFTLVITDFGVPKVIGGQFNMLATDIYKQVVGQQNFQMGAVVSLILLLPAVLAFFVERWAQSQQSSALSSRAVPYQPTPRPARDWALLGLVSGVAFLILGILGMAGFASLAKLWPYNLSLTLSHYDFSNADGGSWASYGNSIRLALYTAIFGSIIVFAGAYLVEKARVAKPLRTATHLLALIPMAVPGMVLGLAYIFFFNAPANPLNFLYGSMTILVLATIAHFYTVSHLTALTALKQLDPEFESVSASLKTPFYRTFWRVTTPMCLPAILDIGIYFFINAMTTVSAVVFLYSPNTTLASVAVLNMDDAGDTAPAAAMAMLIVLTAGVMRLLHAVLSRWLHQRTQAWRQR